MSIKVTVTTHRWPAMVTLTEHSEGDDAAESTVADTLIPGDTSQTFNIGHLAHLNIREVDPGALGPTDEEGNDAEHADGSVVKAEDASSADLPPATDAGNVAAASTAELTKATDADGSLAPGAEEGNV